MGLLRRGKRSGRAKSGRLGALGKARPTLEGELGLRSGGSAGICFRPGKVDDFMRSEQNLDELLGVVAQQSSASVRRRSDSYGFEWLVVRERDLDGLVDSVGLVASELERRGFGGQLDAAVFGFGGRGEHPVYLVYGFRTGTFWPFVPTGEGQERANDEEIGLRDELKAQLPFEPRLENWLGLFDPPIDD